MLKTLLVAGARPNFMKIAPLYKRMQEYSNFFQPIFVHTGQHYDQNMSHSFIESLGLPDPDVFLGIGSGSHAVQTANIMIEFEKVLLSSKPDLIIVVGDVNSTIACALVASKLSTPIAHIEAGLRSYDREMPEEINRILTDQISDLLFITSPEAEGNLMREGIQQTKIHFVGNLMIESLIQHIDQIDQSTIRYTLPLKNEQYALLTLHRPSNVDHAQSLEAILNAVVKISKNIPVIFPAHPRTQKQIQKFQLNMKDFNDRLYLLNPIGYYDFLNLQKNAKFVMTDSGGIQEETTYFGVPCLTIRNNTERPITTEVGTNQLIGTDPNKLIAASQEIISGHVKPGDIPKYWDDKVSERIIQILMKYK